MRFLKDPCFPEPVARSLEAAGHCVDRSLSLDQPDTPDVELVRVAIARRAILLTEDRKIANSPEIRALLPQSAGILVLRSHTFPGDWDWVQIATYVQEWLAQQGNALSGHLMTLAYGKPVRRYPP